MKKAINKVNELITKCDIKYLREKNKIRNILSQQSGEGFVDTALKILISVVVGAVLLAGLYMLFSDTILPILTERITELFDYSA